MNKNLELLLVLDDSGSMSSVSQKLPDVLKRVVKRLKKDKVTGNITIQSLNSTCNYHGSIADIRESSINDYRPTGGTPLYSCINRALNGVSKTGNTLALIMSDGQADTYTGADQIVQEIESRPNLKVIGVIEGEHAQRAFHNIGVFQLLSFQKPQIEALEQAIMMEIDSHMNKI